MTRHTIFNETFENLDAWTHRDSASGEKYSRGDESALTLTEEGLQMRIVPLDVAPDGEQCYGYGYIGTVGTVTVLPGDIVTAQIQWAPGRGKQDSLWLQSETPYGTPADYEADIEHGGAKNPLRRTGVPLQQAVHWRAQGQIFGQFTSIKVAANSNDVLGERTPWSATLHNYSIRVREDGFSFHCDKTTLNRILTERRPRPMFICLSNISRDWNHEDLEEAFLADPENGPGVMTVKRLWVSRPV